MVSVVEARVVVINVEDVEMVEEAVVVLLVVEDCWLPQVKLPTSAWYV